MTTLCCTPCRVRLPRGSASTERCPDCGGPLVAVAPHDALGCALWSPARLDLDALAQAVAALPPSHVPH
jgi:hypothetical protein